MEPGHVHERIGIEWKLGTSDKQLKLVLKLYVYKFARKPIDENTFVILYNQDSSYNGINNGVTVFMGYRMYVDVQTTIGPYPGDTKDGNYFSFAGPPNSEVFFDQAIVFTNTPP